MKKIIYFLSTLVMSSILILSISTFSYHAKALEPEDEAWVQEASTALKELTADREIMALVYLCQEYPIRATASHEGEVVLNVPSGQTVFIQDVVVDNDYEVWEYVSFYMGEAQYAGYIPRTYLACSDERFLNWENEYGMNPQAYSMLALDEGESRSYLDIEQFPESYRAALTALKKSHPNWTFVAMNTGLDWNTVIANEIGDGKSLVHSSLPDCTKEGAYDNGGWYYASKEALEYYMDPRNGLTEDRIFQFEQLTYNESYHTEAAVEAFLNNTFMNSSKNAPGTSMTFAHIFWAIGKEDIRKVSPFHLAARVYQEQGDGSSSLISGTYPGYEKCYNYFNIGATGTTTKEVIENGLSYAKKQGWNDAYFSILGGADVISKNYIIKGQDTLYLQKYNVNPQSQHPLYTHQYMQNISAPTSEAKSIKKLYESANSLNSPFVFKIPVFLNMPGSACSMPESSTNVVLQMPSGFTDTTVYLDGVPYKAEARNGRSIVKAPGSGVKTAVVYQLNASGVPVDMYVWTLSYKNGAYTATPQPGLQNLLSYHGFSIRITGKSGIRFKTGISADTRAALTTGGVAGYKLKEYGTLVMNNANRNQYPMIKNGEKVLSGMSYGINSGGALEDKIYETVSGRYRYTSVLVGLPADQYKVEYAFRGYAVLEKDGTEIVIYGPIVAKSIYELAKQVLDMGTYQSGTEADAFLRKLIADADALAVSE